MDIVAYALAKKFALKVSAGYSSVSVDEATSTINFTLNDGQKVSLKIPTPNGIKDIQINANRHIIITLTDDSTIDAGVLPATEVEISKVSGNALVQKPDGLYVTKSGVQISQKQYNAMIEEEDGLYVPSLDNSDEQGKIIDIVNDNVASETDINDIFKNF